MAMIGGSHSSVHARREDKMSRWHTTESPTFEGLLLYVAKRPSPTQRQICKRSSNAKRRRRDRQESERY